MSVRKIVEAVLSAGHGSACSVADAVHLLRATSAEDVGLITQAADALRQRAPCGNKVSFVINRNVNFTNACVKRCGFCAFSRTGKDQEAYYLPSKEVVRRAKEAAGLGATEVCVQAGLPLRDAEGVRFTGHTYLQLVADIKAAVPDLHVHALSPEEVVYGAQTAKLSVREFIALAVEAGVGSLPGTSAEILDDTIRSELAPGRLSTAQWLDVITEAHRAGLPTSSTMMYGHIETPEHVAAHLHTLRTLQHKTSGFTEFVPLSFVASEAPVYKDRAKRKSLQVRSGPTGREVVLTHAVARIMLAGCIDNVQVSWPKEGLRMAQVLLNCGANDLGGVLMNESISTAAGATHGQCASPKALRLVAQDAGRVAVQRNTVYDTLRTFGAATEWDEDNEPELQRAFDDATATFGSYHELIRAGHWRTRSVWQQRTRSSPSGSGRRGYCTAVTYSRSFTVVPTYECFNKCTYCNFRRNVTVPAPGVAPEDHPGWLSVEAARKVLQELKTKGEDRVVEVLVMAGEVQPKSRLRRHWYMRIMDICREALGCGFLPHTNVGPLSRSEMEGLASVNASMGLMLEQIAPRLQHKGEVHEKAPSKAPDLRIQQLEMAGQLRIPFTTGLLLGIGEGPADRIRTLEAIAESHARHGHIQEVILQPHSLGGQQRYRGDADWAIDLLPDLVETARDMLPADVKLQVPPNLVLVPGIRGREDILKACLDAGVRDLGGISPLDEVNPDYAFPSVDSARGPSPDVSAAPGTNAPNAHEKRTLKAILSSWGYSLEERLPVHPALWGWMRPAPKAVATALA